MSNVKYVSAEPTDSSFVDFSLHQYIVEAGLLSTIVELIQSFIADASHHVTIMPLLLSAVSCLLSMSLVSTEVRHVLCENVELIHDLLKCKLLEIVSTPLVYLVLLCL